MEGYHRIRRVFDVNRGVVTEANEWNRVAPLPLEVQSVQDPKGPISATKGPNAID